MSDHSTLIYLAGAAFLLAGGYAGIFKLLGTYGPEAAGKLAALIMLPVLNNPFLRKVNEDHEDDMVDFLTKLFAAFVTAVKAAIDKARKDDEAPAVAPGPTPAPLPPVPAVPPTPPTPPTPPAAAPGKCDHCGAPMDQPDRCTHCGARQKS